MPEDIKQKMDKALSVEITTPCPYHPAGRNSLILSPFEREIIMRIVEDVLGPNG